MLPNFRTYNIPIAIKTVGIEKYRQTDQRKSRKSEKDLHIYAQLDFENFIKTIKLSMIDFSTDIKAWYQTNNP